MSKQKLTPFEITAIINAYLSAVALRHGERARDRTELRYRKGIFLLRPHTIAPTAPAIPFRAREIEAMTREMKGVPR